MDTIQINKHLNYLIIPFTYGLPYESALNTINNGLWEKQVPTYREHIFDHISNLVNEGCKEAIGQHFTLGSKGRTAYSLPKNKNYQYTYRLQVKGELHQIKFELPEIELYLFETQVGFLIYKIQYAGPIMVDDLNLFNYHLKHLAQSKGELTFEQKPLELIIQELKTQGFYPEGLTLRMKYGKKAAGIVKELQELDPEKPYEQLDMAKLEAAEAGKEQAFELSWLSHHLLNDLNPATYFENHFKKETRLPSYGLFFSAVTLDESFNTLDKVYQNKKLGDYLFRLRRTFKQSYKPSPYEYDLAQNPEIMQAFENSYWGVSLEGMTNLTYLVGDANTNTFIEGNYYGNLEKNYLYLYILSLHQRYALIYMTMKASELTNRMDEYISAAHDKEAYQQLMELMGKITFFTLRCSYKQVSNITHQARLYEMIRESLKIEDLLNELHFEFDSLSSIIKMKNTEERTKQLELEKEASRQAEENRKIDEENRLLDEERTKIKDEHSQAFSTFIAILSIFFVTISTLGDGWSVLTQLSTRYPTVLAHLPQLQFYLQSVIVAIFIVSFIVYFSLSRKKRKKLEDLENRRGNH